MVAKLLIRSSWRFHRQHPLQLLLSMFGIVLGVGIVTSVLITNNSAVRAFALASEALYGRATHQIVAANGISDSAAAAFIRSHSELTIAPVIEGELEVDQSLITLIGLDPFLEAEFGRLQLSGDSDSDVTALTMTDLPIWASEATAERLALTVGQPLQLGNQTTTVAGIFSTASRAASDGLLVTDISVAQTVLQRIGSIDRLEMVLSDVKAEKLNKQLPPQWRMQATAQRQSTMQAMTRGFQINLTAMSLLALLVGMFLIHNTMTFAVLQRREVFAMKRIIGISARGLFAIVLGEALVFSTIASILGLLCGILIAQKLLQLTTQTINDLYFVLHVQQLHISPLILFGGVVLGIGSSLIAASLAAREAATRNAIEALRRSAIEERTKNLLPLLLIAGLICLTIGALLAWLPSQSLLLGFAALMIIIMGYGLCIPWLSQHLLLLARYLCGQRIMTLAVALGSLTGNMSRTGLAIAALAVAVSATLGVDIMIGSFRNSVDVWLTKTLRSDVYLTLGDMDATGRTETGNVSTQWLQQLNAIDGVKDISTGTVLDVVTNLDTFDLLVLNPNSTSEKSYEWLHTESDNTWLNFQSQRTVLISEPLANKHQLTAGDSISLFTATQGDVVFEIAGVYRDYGSSHGRLVIHRATYAQYWNNTTIGSIGVMLDDNTNRNTVMQRVRNLSTTAGVPIQVRDNTSIHQESLDIFDRTFAVTRVLRWLTMGVAFIGIFSALLAMHLERARDFAILRASGGSQTQLRYIIGLQSLCMGITAGLIAIPLGWFMSEILIHIINVRSFGWRMSSLLPPTAVPQALLLSIGAAILAGIYPAWRLGRQSLVKELRNE